MDLLEMERRFWLDGADFYRQNLAGDVLMVFPGVGAIGRADIIAGVEDAPRWIEVEIENEHTRDLAPDARLLCYRAAARRQEGAEYSAFVSSVYVRRDDAWKLAFHQHTSV